MPSLGWVKYVLNIHKNHVKINVLCLYFTVLALFNPVLFDEVRDLADGMNPGFA